MIFGGIDPGKKGALVLLTIPEPTVVKFDKKSYINCLKACSTADIIIGLELVHSMPKQGVKSMFSFGENFGWIQGVLDVLELKYEFIRSQEWKKHFGLIGSDKKQSCIKALELEPTLQCKGKRGGLQDGICDAYLIAKYLKDKYEEEHNRN